MMIVEKKLYFTFQADGLLVLVPKKRGNGFLKTPYGHHTIQALDDILDQATLLAKNLYGLDGYLYFQVKTYSGDEEKIAPILMPLLETYYGFVSEYVGNSLFFDILKSNNEETVKL